MTFREVLSSFIINEKEYGSYISITYIGGRGNAYLSLITDAYSKQIMGYDLSASLAIVGSLRALKMANKNRIYRSEPLIYHSNRGLQYCSNDYQKVLEQNKITPSMTESYAPYANAIAERVDGMLKQEFLLEDYKVVLQTMKLLVSDAIQIYNTKRPHWSLLYENSRTDALSKRSESENL